MITTEMEAKEEIKFLREELRETKELLEVTRIAFDMTPLDEFAKAAMQIILSDDLSAVWPDKTAVAGRAYYYADAMMAEKKKREAA